jgi:hypothetical protein
MKIKLNYDQAREIVFYEILSGNGIVVYKTKEEIEERIKQIMKENNG